MKSALKDQMKEAMKAKNKVRLDAIRGLLSEIQYEEMQREVSDLDPESCLQVVQRGLKKLKEELEYAGKAGRPELAEKLDQEILVLESLLPRQLSEGELEDLLVSLKSADPELNMGRVMKILKEQHSGRYDGRLASEVAKRVFG